MYPFVSSTRLSSNNNVDTMLDVLSVFLCLEYHICDNLIGMFTLHTSRRLLYITLVIQLVEGMPSQF